MSNVNYVARDSSVTRGCHLSCHVTWAAHLTRQSVNLVVQRWKSDIYHEQGCLVPCVLCLVSIPCLLQNINQRQNIHIFGNKCGVFKVEMEHKETLTLLTWPAHAAFFLPGKKIWNKILNVKPLICCLVFCFLANALILWCDI